MSEQLDLCQFRKQHPLILSEEGRKGVTWREPNFGQRAAAALSLECLQMCRASCRRRGEAKRGREGRSSCVLSQISEAGASRDAKEEGVEGQGKEGERETSPSSPLGLGPAAARPGHNVAPPKELLRSFHFPRRHVR